MAEKFPLLTATLIFLLFGFTQAFADTLEQAMAEFERGNFADAQTIWQDMAEDGDLDATYNLGQLYHLGQGVPFNENEAAAYFLTAAQGGHTAAQRELANIYFFSSGTSEHQRAAIQWWQQAAAAGDGRSQYILGVLLFNGDLVPQDMSRGFAWTLLAIDAGIREAIQSETAMRGQLGAGDLARSIDLSRTLMTSNPDQADYTLLVAEEAPGRRYVPPTRVAEATPPPVVEEPEPEIEMDSATEDDTSPPDMEESEPEAEIDTAMDGATEEVLSDPDETATEVASEFNSETENPVQDPIVEDVIPEPVVEDATAEMVSDDSATTLEPEPAIELPQESDPNVIEVETDVVNDAPVEVAPITTPDLGDPLSPLVDAVGFEGQWRVQVTSFRMPENADQHWQDVNADYPEIFSGLEKRIVRADLGPERGVYYRLRVGPFDTKEDADLKCQEMVDAGMGCLVIWP